MAELSSIDAAQILSTVRQTLETEAAALTAAAARADGPFVAAVKLMFHCSGKVVLTGLGKSGHVARKVASTLSSTGTSSFFLHPTEALHGDFGMVQSSDVVVAIAFGGETAEVLEVVRFARRRSVPVIAITGKVESTLASLAEVVLDGSVPAEACPLRLAPTSSSTLAMAIGDALAMAVMRLRGFGEVDFAQLHPGGRLGRKLALVKDHMHTGQAVPLANISDDFHQLLAKITERNFGIVGVVDEQGNLVGCITDGDVRRALLQRGAGALGTRAGDLVKPGAVKAIGPDALALDAVTLMEQAPKCTALFVLEKGTRTPIGIVRIHDILQAKII